MGYNPNFRTPTGRGFSNGGFSPVDAYCIIPGLSSGSGSVSLNAFNWNAGFNDPNNASFHYFRVEEVATMRVPDFRRVGIIYRDLGVATIQIALTAVNDNGDIVYNTPNQGAPSGGNPYPSFAIGTAAASQRLIQKFLDTRICGSLPQAAILRAANAGPVSISKFWLTTEVEQTSY